MFVKIPGKFLHKIDEFNDWGADVRRVASNVSEYFMRDPFFFPEYSIHGIKHINNVLDICSKLIPDECIQYLTSRDLSLLIISVIMHDIGMFIDRDGVYELLYGKYGKNRINDLDKQTWNELWNIHIRKVRRYPDKVLLKLFGVANQIQIPPSNMKELTYIDTLVYGDFLRQNHPRLSHQIIETGFMGIETIDVLRETIIDDKLRNIIGLLARSHGMEIRNTKTYLSKRFVNVSKPKGVPIFYLMALLRVADYLDAGQGRVPREIQLMHEHVSQLSKSEWDWNQSIDYQDYTWDKNLEILTIHSSPKNSIQFNNVYNWLKNIQNELDLCWAVLGEHYGFEKKWLLSIRRINSNIIETRNRDYFENFFLTKPANIAVNPDILKILIGPLYDENPSCGLRELIQNAVDACREREVKEKTNGNNDYKGEVLVKICSKEKYLLIEDNGIGMTADTLMNYYLVAGSSYRYSDNWANEFVVEEKNIIPRTGKFGIGVLSTFLLGKCIHVKTRNIDDIYGLKFDLELNDSIINVTRDCTINIGTQIKIELTHEMLNKISRMKLIASNGTVYIRSITGSFNDLNDREVRYGILNKYIQYEWFFFENPTIKYVVDEIEKTNSLLVPDESSIDHSWFALENTNFKSYKWQYGDPLSPLSGSYNPLIGIDKDSFNCDNIETTNKFKFFCNGIMVPNVFIPNYQNKLDVEIPSISIVDYDNVLKISLNRNSCELPNIKELYVELYKYYVASMLICPLKTINSGKFKAYNLIFYKGCFTIDNVYFLRIANIKKFYVIINANTREARNKLADLPFLSLKLNTKKLRDQGYCFNCFNSNNILNISCDLETKKYFMQNYDYLDFSYEAEYNGKKIFQMHYSENIKNIYCQINCKMVIEYGINYSNDHNFYYKGHIYFMNFCKEIVNNFFAEDMNDDLVQVINEYLLGDIWIPLNIDERKKKYKSTFDSLNNYINDCKRKKQ